MQWKPEICILVYKDTWNIMIPNNQLFNKISENKKMYCTFEGLWLLAVVLQKTWTDHASNIHHYPQSIPWKTLRFQKNMFTQFWGAWYATFFVVICNAHFYLQQTESMRMHARKRSRINFISFLFITLVNIVTTTTRFGCAEN